MDEQISEKFAKEFLLKMTPDTWFKFFETKNEEIIINYWKQKGYIKQSREDELKEVFNKLKRLYGVEKAKNKNIEDLMELIEILDEKINKQ